MPKSDVVSSIPWLGDESVTYLVKSKSGAELGHQVLAIAKRGSQSELSQRFSGSETTDNSSVIVEATTLKPASAKREINAKDDTRVIETTYSEAGALIKDGDKQSGLSVPEHSYDNDTSLFLWRTLAFAPNYEAAYTTIITNRRSKQDVTLKVIGRETVKVVAGEFQAWRLEIKAGGAKQTAWYADTPTRPLVKYDNDNGLIFELEKLP